MSRLDTHLHLWDPAQFPYSWVEGIPALRRAFSVDDYAAASAGCDVTKAIFVECDVDPPHALDEARHVQTLSEAHPFIAGIVAAGRPGEADFPAHLEALRDLPKVRGIRQVLHPQPADYSRHPAFREGLRRLPAFGYTFDLCVLASQLPAAIDLVEACPEVSFILDHGGIPDIKNRAFEPWRSDLRRLAAFPNVIGCKLSGLVVYTDPKGWTVDDLRPWFEDLVAIFGWERLVWGGDWPVCTLAASLRAWVEATDTLLAEASPAERSQLLWHNAERIYRV